ncbi:hypothetical protein LIER_12114 [Lithospermum erythrorhizon]|uniref:Uncharacterized protein n=1 Tax=Lithospermum erythrorhizon TaxID=34254 RepID=A0AAV3PTH8_LITER
MTATELTNPGTSGGGAPPQRRPRVREVSSRFMSPLIHEEDTIRRSLDTPKSVLISSINRKRDPPKSRQKLFKENGDPHTKDYNNNGNSKTLLQSSIWRSDVGTDRIVQSRYKQSTNPLQRSFSGVSAATKLLQEATCSDDMLVSKIVTTGGEQRPISCPNSPICVTSNKALLVPDRHCENVKLVAPSPCSRSLDFRNGDNMSSRSVLKTGVLPLPPHPKLGSLDSRRGGKKGGQQEDANAFKLMHNHLLQWRFANAKAEASIQAQKTEAERQLYSLGSNIAGLRDSVERKRIELARLQRITILSTILQGHMPDLDRWSDLEEDYSSSLSGMTNALLNASLRLPIGSEIRQVDVTELREVLDSASKVVESIGSQIQSFIPQADELDGLSSEVARVAAGEKALVEECGSLTLKLHSSHVNEWSLRGHLIQLKGTKTSTSF